MQVLYVVVLYGVYVLVVWDLFYYCFDLCGEFVEFVQVWIKDFDCQIVMNVDDYFGNVYVDWLCEVVVDFRQLIEYFVDFFDQFVFVFYLLIGVWFQDQEGVGLVQFYWVQVDFIGVGVCDDVGDFGNVCYQCLIDFEIQCCCFFQVD